MGSFSNPLFPLWSSEVTARIVGFNFLTVRKVSSNKVG